ncbi:hypothetical protein JCM11754A_27900 [Isoptericola variabilis]
MPPEASAPICPLLAPSGMTDWTFFAALRAAARAAAAAFTAPSFTGEAPWAVVPSAAGADGGTTGGAGGAGTSPTRTAPVAGAVEVVDVVPDAGPRRWVESSISASRAGGADDALVDALFSVISPRPRSWSARRRPARPR